MRVITVGGGPAGIMASLRAAEKGHSVLLLEQNDTLGKKMKITGKGRCNITNAGDDIMDNIIRNPEFLYSALHGFSNYDAIDFFEKIGVPTKIERGMRVFPQNDSAPSVVTALMRALKNAGVEARRARVKKILTENGRVCGILEYGGRVRPCDAAVLATGGVSYPQTGSKGDGFKMAEMLGHTVTPLTPSLVPLCADTKICCRLMGLSLKNIGFKLRDKDEVLYSDFGEMIFTHFGISGPIVLSASCHLKNSKNLFAVIDLKPALSEQELDKRLLRDFEEYSRRDYINSLDRLLPKKLIEPFAELTGVDLRKKCCEITRAERHNIVLLLKEFKIHVYGARPIDEAIVTSGGISTHEINPKTMESKIVKELYFAGEIIDVSAYTGGYNLQIAYSTGYAAGNSI